MTDAGGPDLRQQRDGAAATGAAPSMSRSNAAPAGAGNTFAALVAPSISLPKGGGAIRDIGEKFETNPVNGTAALSVPLGLTAGRSGFGPELALAYDSGAGNGPFGFGWSLAVPAITRKTDKGLPLYDDGSEADVFLISDAEDLVPVARADGSRWTEQRWHGGVRHVVHRYRPRIEGMLARIERWTAVATGDVHWRSISRTNVTTVYGRSADSRIADPADARRVFTWLACERRDDKGNALVFEYAVEDDAGVDVELGSERNRERRAQRYLKRISYGNRVSHLVDPDFARAGWLFHVVLDYDEGHVRSLPLDPGRPAAEQHAFVEAHVEPAHSWRVRPDAFSAYRAGFEVRTHRRCRRILMFHDIPELAPGPTLISATQLDYDDYDVAAGGGVADELAHQGSSRFASFLRRVRRSGYVRQHGDVYLEKSLPPLELTYSRPVIAGEVRALDDAAGVSFPTRIDPISHTWLDLDGEGLPGLLTQAAGAWYYSANLGDGRFGPTQPVASPAAALLAPRRQAALDLGGNGRLDVVDLGGPDPGFYERRTEQGWEGFRPFALRPNIDWNAADLRFVDLTGDGRADVLVAEGETITWHRSRGTEGFDAAERRDQELDEERGPRLLFADGTQSVYLADMSGDGLSDVVRIRNGSICYWPNLGYGRFGSKVAMDAAPSFDRPDLFSQDRVRLVDVDGSGTTDILYLGDDGARIYFNQCGNRWTAPLTLPGFPRFDNLSSVTALDLLGKGTGCLVWSSPLPGDAERPLRYIDLMADGKPHLLTSIDNNLGVETRVEYASSTMFHLRDKQKRQPWPAPLPFPVQVVVRVTTIDAVNRGKLVSRHAYHDGWYDHEEREFRGFGMVEQWDSEASAGLESDVPPAYTRTWFHMGRIPDEERDARAWSGHWDEPDAWRCEPPSAGPTLPPDLTDEERREAFRALKGAMLRQEIYGQDGSEDASRPYTVTSQTFGVRVLQRLGQNRHAVILRIPGETVKCQYERDPADPRVSHQVTLDVDDFGNVLQECTVAYGRRGIDPHLRDVERHVQARTLTTWIVNRVTNAVEEDDVHRTPLPCETMTFELTGLRRDGGTDLLTVAQARAAAHHSVEVEPSAAPTDGRLERRLVERVRTYYRRDDLSGRLPFGALESGALPYESYRLALTDDVVRCAFGDRVTATILAEEGGYVRLEDGAAADGWWAPSGRRFYAPDRGTPPEAELALARRHFFNVRRYRGPLDRETAQTETVVAHDPYDLLVEQTTDAAGNTTTLLTGDDSGEVVRGIDYRMLQPFWLTDANGNRTRVVFDALGRVTGVARQGKPAPALAQGDSLDGFASELTEAETLACLGAPLTRARALLGRATQRFVYGEFAYERTRATGDPQPITVYNLARESWASDEAELGESRLQHSFTYSDGLGREVQVKTIAEPDAEGRPRWTGSGWVVLNNKGKPVRQFEPFFSATHRFEFDLRVGVSPFLVYDPLGRVIAILHPDRTWEKTWFTAWRQERWDVNDTVLAGDPGRDAQIGGYVSRLPMEARVPTWYEARADGAMDAEERRAATQTALHAATPTVQHADPLGRTFVTVTHNRFRPTGAPDGAAPVEEFYRSLLVLDVAGNDIEAIDAVDRVVARSRFGLDRSRLHLASMDAGERWWLDDVLGNQVREWDSRSHCRRTEYDVLRRPVRMLVTGIDPDAPDREFLTERRVYGEQVPDAGAQNLRTRLALQLDQAGLVASEAYDFIGNLVRSSRRMAVDDHSTLTWLDVDRTTLPGDARAVIDVVAFEAAVAAMLEGEWHRNSTRYDALQRPILLTSPDGSRVRNLYNEARLLRRIEADIAGPDGAGGGWQALVADVEYDARGRRTRLEYGNGTVTDFAYDPLSFRLVHVRTRRPRDPAAPASPRGAGWTGTVVQDLAYTFDPAGNVLHVHDRAQQDVFFRNRRVEPSVRYVYDATYRLVEATGREHLGQQPSRPIPYSHDDAPRVGLPQPGDGLAMARYVERYVYDAADNLLRMQHIGSDPSHSGWTRDYTYAERSAIEEVRNGDRLSSTRAGDDLPEQYSYDAHGNATRLPHLGAREEPGLGWNDLDQLQRCQLAPGRWLSFAYDTAAHRVRKVLHGVDGSTETRTYLGLLEIFRRRDAAGQLVLERRTLKIGDGHATVALMETRTHDTGDDPAPAQLLRYQLGNHLGSVVLELDEHSRVISYEEYSPYGSTTYQAVRAQTDTPKRYRFAGMERDEETGLAYHTARYYMPWLGRWLSCDPAGVRAGTNLYVYVADCPTRLVDPAGLDGWDRFWGGVKAVGGALEVVAGGALIAAGVATSEIGIGIAIGAAGVAVGAHGIDTVQSGVRTAASGSPVDTFTSKGLQKAGLSRTTANLVDAGIGVVGTLGAGAVAKAPAVVAAARTGTEAEAVVTAARTGSEADALVHLTTESAATTINTTQTLGKGASTIYAGPASLAQAEGAGITLRTGLLPSQATTAVTIPNSAAGAFRVPGVVGPVTAWQRGFGTVYSAGEGSINLTTGVFTRTGPAWNQIGIYGIDATINMGVRTIGVLHGAQSYPTSDVRGVSLDPTGTFVLDPTATAATTLPNPFLLDLNTSSTADVTLTTEEVESQQCVLPTTQDLLTPVSR